jgi:hypothetical protein
LGGACKNNLKKKSGNINLIIKYIFFKQIKRKLFYM